MSLVEMALHLTSRKFGSVRWIPGYWTLVVVSRMLASAHVVKIAML